MYACMNALAIFKENCNNLRGINFIPCNYVSCLDEKSLHLIRERFFSINEINTRTIMNNDNALSKKFGKLKAIVSNTIR